MAISASTPTSQAHRRIPSSDSVRSSSSNEDEDEQPTTPLTRSTSALVLVHDEEEGTAGSFSDDEDGGASPTHMVDARPVPELVLPPSVVFGYFLSPSLKLGAMLVLGSQAPLTKSLPALFVFSFLSVFARQIWFLLAKYTRKNKLEDIVLAAFARDRSWERTRSAMKAATRLGSGSVRLLVSVMYLKHSIGRMESLTPERILFIPTTLFLSFITVLILAPLSFVHSLESKRLVYANGLSNALYIVWLGAIIFAHVNGSLDSDTITIAHGRLLQDVSAMAFTFSSVSTLQLYSGMMGLRASADQKEKRYLSISSMSTGAGLLGTALVLPLLFPSVKSLTHDRPSEESTVVQILIATLTSLILLLGIPPLVASIPPVYLPVPPRARRVLRPRTLSTAGMLLLIFALALLPPAIYPVLEDTTVLLVFGATYLLPALLHIVLHQLRRPLSILVAPQAYPVRRSASEQSDDSRASAGPGPGQDPEMEELLIRKERALQRRRLGRRILWDVGVWVLLVPVGGGGIVWSVGRIIDAW